VDGKILSIKRQALGWSGVEEARGDSGTVALRYGQHEIGQLDLDDGLADLPVPQGIRDNLLSKGRAMPHREGSEGLVSYPAESDEDVAVVLEILGWNYDRAREAAGPPAGDGVDEA
jgi:luciferase-like monooxygenase